MEQVKIGKNGIGYIKTPTELQQEIDQHEETIALGKALAKLLKASDPDRAGIETIVSKHEQHRDSKKAEKEARKHK